MYAIKSVHDGIAVLSLKGKLVTTEDNEALQEDVKEVIKNNPKGLVINMRQLNWVSSTGISGIIRCLSMIKKAGGEFGLTGLNDKVQNIITLTQLDKVIPVFPSVEDAVARFKA